MATGFAALAGMLAYGLAAAWWEQRSESRRAAAVFAERERREFEVLWLEGL